MKTPKLSILLVCLLLIFQSHGARTDSGDEPKGDELKEKINKTLHGMQLRYQSLKTLQADFTQITYRHNIMGNLEEIEQEGELHIKKPGKLRWQYTKPENRLYVSNGKTLWIYDAEEKQVTQSGWNPKDIALQFLLGLGDVQKDFDSRNLTSKEEKEFQVKDGNWVYLTPKKDPDKPETLGLLQALLLKIDIKKHLVHEDWILDPMGSKTHWHFQNIKINHKLNDSLFRFTPPEGTQAVKY